MLINNKYEILTPTGFQDFSGIQKINSDCYVEILIGSADRIKCSPGHIFQLETGQLKRARELALGDIIKSKSVARPITNISIMTEDIELYDLLNVSNGSLYYTDNLISHNCDVDFLTSGATVVDPDDLSWYEKEMIKEPIQKRGYADDIWIWKYVDYTKTYIVTADVARGDGSDFSTFHVLELDSLEQVAEYKGKIDTTTFGKMLVAIATEYNNALLIIENTGIGYSVVQVALDLNYSNIHYSYRNDPFLDENIHLAKNLDLKNKKDMIPGFTTSHITRPILVSKIDIYFREHLPKIYSKRTLDELRVFVWKPGGRGEAERGFNDDLVMALAIGIFLRDTAIKLRQIGIELTKRTLDRTHKTIHKPGIASNDPWKVPNARGGTDDLRWLL